MDPKGIDIRALLFKNLIEDLITGIWQPSKLLVGLTKEPTVEQGWEPISSRRRNANNGDDIIKVHNTNQHPVFKLKEGEKIWDFIKSSARKSKADDGKKEICLNYHLRGWCSTICPMKVMHRFLSSAEYSELKKFAKEAKKEVAKKEIAKATNEIADKTKTSEVIQTPQDEEKSPAKRTGCTRSTSMLKLPMTSVFFHDEQYSQYGS